MFAIYTRNYIFHRNINENTKFTQNLMGIVIQLMLAQLRVLDKMAYTWPSILAFEINKCLQYTQETTYSTVLALEINKCL